MDFPVFQFTDNDNPHSCTAETQGAVWQLKVHTVYLFKPENSYSYVCLCKQETYGYLIIGYF